MRKDEFLANLERGGISPLAARTIWDGIMRGEASAQPAEATGDVLSAAQAEVERLKAELAEARKPVNDGYSIEGHDIRIPTVFVWRRTTDGYVSFGIHLPNDQRLFLTRDGLVLGISQPHEIVEWLGAQRERNARLAAEGLIDEVSRVADKAIQCCMEGQDVWYGVESIRKSIAAFRAAAGKGVSSNG